MNEHDETHDHDASTDPGPDDEREGAVAVDDGPTEPPPPGPGTPPGPGAPPPGPGPADTPLGQVGDRGLVRDPHASFGGVLSGIAHRYGWSVVAVRLAFVALLLVSFGTALLLYLAAWVIVPRAKFWPPAVVRRPGDRLSNRDLGLAVAGVGLVTFLVIGTDGAASVLVPLVLVGAGIWLLLQHQRDPGQPSVAAPTGPDATVPVFATPPPVGQPVAPRRRRTWVLRILVLGVVVTMLAAAAVSVAIVRGGRDGFNLTFGDDRLVVGNYRPDSLDGLPNEIDAQVGGVRLDLTDIPLAEFEALSEPFELDIDIENGVVDLTLPEGLDVSIDAFVDDGRLDLDDATLPGADIGPSSIVLVDPDADIEIFVAVGDGELQISTEP